MKWVVFLLVFLLTWPCFADLPPRGQPGHDRPNGVYVNEFIKTEYGNGWEIGQQLWMINDPLGNQFMFQGFYQRFQPFKVKMSVFWVLHEDVELIETIGPKKSVIPYYLWIDGGSDSRKPLFEKGRKDAPICYMNSNDPFDRGIMIADVENYSFVDRIKLPEHIKPWAIQDLDGDSFFEIVCADLSFIDEFPISSKPHALRIYRFKNGKIVDTTNSFKETTKIWDDQLTKATKSSKDYMRIGNSISLALSLKLHGHPDPMSVVTPILTDLAGYTDGIIPALITEIQTELKEKIDGY